MLVAICILAISLKLPVYGLEEYNLPLTDETQSQINRFLVQYPQYEDYLMGTLSELKESTIATDIESVNELIRDTIEQLCNFKQQGDIEYKSVLENHEKQVAAHKTKSKSVKNEAYDILLGNYTMGTYIVENAGCPNAARYMRHAVVPEGLDMTPSTLYDTNTDWAEFLVYDCYDFYGQVFSQFEEEILGMGEESGTVTGSFAYTSENSSLDALASLHAVDYIVTFIQADNGYNVIYAINDTFDFDWNEYENFAIDFANNYCYAMQINGYIKPFQIIITVTEGFDEEEDTEDSSL